MQLQHGGGNVNKGKVEVIQIEEGSVWGRLTVAKVDTLISSGGNEKRNGIWTRGKEIKGFGTEAKKFWRRSQGKGRLSFNSSGKRRPFSILRSNFPDSTDFPGEKHKIPFHSIGNNCLNRFTGKEVAEVRLGTK